MEKSYQISEVRIEKNMLIIIINKQVIELKLSDISDKLGKANESEKNDFKVSPSGYGIHWRLLDEDLSINGLLKLYSSKHKVILHE